MPEDPAPSRGVPFRSNGDEEACRASSRTVSFRSCTRLKTLNMALERGQTTLKAQLAAEVAHESAARPEDRC